MPDTSTHNHLREFAHDEFEVGYVVTFVFFKHEDEGKGPRFAKRFLELAE